MGVSLGVYRARIRLFSLRSATDLNYSSDYMCSATYLAWLMKSPWVLATAAWMFLSDNVNVVLFWLFVTSMLLACSGDIETNPGPNPRMSNQVRCLTFCHANMRSIKKCPDKLDHIRAEFRGVYDVIHTFNALPWILTFNSLL
jgi:hypothetical protein